MMRAGEVSDTGAFVPCQWADVPAHMNGRLVAKWPIIPHESRYTGCMLIVEQALVFIRARTLAAGVPPFKVDDIAKNAVRTFPYCPACRSNLRLFAAGEVPEGAVYDDLKARLAAQVMLRSLQELGVVV